MLTAFCRRARFLTPHSARINTMSQAATSSSSSAAAAAAAPAAGAMFAASPDVLTAAELRSLQLDSHPSARLPLIYSDSYNIGFFGVEKLHPFDSKKYAKVHAALTDKAAGIARHSEFHVPIEAPERLLRMVHSADYLASLKSSWNVAKILEVPPIAILPNFVVQSRALKPMRIATAGTIIGAELAVRHLWEPQQEGAAAAAAAADGSAAASSSPAAAASAASSSSSSSSSAASASPAASPAAAVAPSVLPGWSINLGGGFHHCSAHSGGGFCPYADISLSILALAQKRPELRRFLILDCDAHQGNGHENDKLDGVFERAGLEVFITDLYNAGIYPQDHRARAAIDCEVRLAHGTGDEAYLAALRKALSRSLLKARPQLLVYNAGTDCLSGDPLGHLDVSAAGIVERDRIVFQMCLAAKVPVLMLLSGGYQATNAAVIARSIANLQQTLGLWTVDPQLLAAQAAEREREGKKKGKSKIKSDL